MRILVLGGTGAMGVELVRVLNNQEMMVDVTTRNEQSLKIPGVHYLVGDAHDMDFLKKIIAPRYNAIVDFMVYGTEEFDKRRDIMLKATSQYIFLSSARVYADSKVLITERTPLILDVCRDGAYLATDEYALTKARQENLLRNSVRKNWTIIRPYITYNSERLQLGVLEKEQWLYRALQGKTIVFTKDIAEKMTTLTYGFDVAQAIAKLIGTKEALGQVFQIASAESMKWETVLKIYLDTIEKLLGKRPKVVMEEDSRHMMGLMGNQYQVNYDRLFDRRFDSGKIKEICNCDITYTPVVDGIEKCLAEFITGKHHFKEIKWKWEAYADKVAGENTRFRQIPGVKAKVNYLIWRYLSVLACIMQNSGIQKVL